MLIVSFFLKHRSVSFPVSRHYHSDRNKGRIKRPRFHSEPTDRQHRNIDTDSSSRFDPEPSRSPATARDRRATTLTTTPRGWRGTGSERGRKKKEQGWQWPVVVVVWEFRVPVRVFFFECLPFHRSLRVEDRSERKCGFGVLPVRSDLIRG